MTPIISHTSVKALKSHPRYRAAKAGDIEAAYAVVHKVWNPWKLRRLQADCVVSVHAEEAAGRNKLPTVFATMLGHAYGWDVDDQIVQSNRVFHTGASALHRLLHRPAFDGPVSRGARYILCDDVTATGATLAALKRYIEQWGGTVVAATVLAASAMPHTGMPRTLEMTDRTRTLLANKFDMLQLWSALFLHDVIKATVEELTDAEGLYVAKYRNIDSLRGRLIACR